MLPRVTIQGRELIADGKPLHLHGVNVGNWLNLENFMFGAPYVDHQMRARFRSALGDERAQAFFDTFEDVYFTKKDAAFLKDMGVNVVRLPFGYRRLESDMAPGTYFERGLALLDHAMACCREQGLYVLLDLHAVPGSQSEDWHADNASVQALFFEVADYQRRAVALWRMLAERYASEPALLGYDLLNEPNTVHHDRLNDFYRKAIAAIRESDRDHLIVVEGSRWATDMDSLATDLYDDPLVMPTFHHYPFFGIEAYPGEHQGKRADREALLETMRDKIDYYGRIERPLLLGECGLSARASAAGALVLRDLLSICKEQGWHFTQWSYKDVGSMGVVSPTEDSPWRSFIASVDAARPKGSEWRAVRNAISEAYSDVPEDVRLLSYKEMSRAQDRLALHRFAEKLAAHTKEELEQMARSFEFSSCKPNQALYETLREFM